MDFGSKKISLVNLFFFVSFLVLIIYLIFSTFITPYTLNKSRKLLSQNNFNSFLPTIKTQQFSDSFKGFTFLVEKKIDNKIKNIFLHDKGNNLKNLTSNASETNEVTIIAENGAINEKILFLFNGQIISQKKNNDNEIISFEQINIDLGDLRTTTIKQPKIQETSTLRLIECFSSNEFIDKNCNPKYKKEIIPTLSRRVITPFYIPVLALVCSLLLIKSQRKFFNKLSIFFYGFSILIFTELAVRYTGINRFIMALFITFPFILFSIIYFFLIYKFSKETKK